MLPYLFYLTTVITVIWAGFSYIYYSSNLTASRKCDLNRENKFQ